jgi:hypothetical protein
MTPFEHNPRQPVFLVVLLLIASLAADFAVRAMAHDQDPPAPAVVFMYALSFSQISLLALFVGLGTAAWLERLAALGAGIAFWVLMLATMANAQPPDAIATLISLHAVTIALLAGLARLIGVRWTDEPSSRYAPASASQRRQLTLARLFGWTTVAAIVAALARHANLPHVADRRIAMSLLLANNAITTFAAAYTVFSYSHPAWSMAGAIVLCIASVTLTNHDYERFLIPMNVLHLLLVATALAVCRAAGLRMIRLGSV